MCIGITSEVYAIEKDTEAFKVCRTMGTGKSTRYFSEFGVFYRSPQKGLKDEVVVKNRDDSGRYLEYRIGETLTSPIPRTPGFYLLPDLESAKLYANFNGVLFAKLKVLILAGTPVFNGIIYRSLDSAAKQLPTINAAEIKILGLER